MFIFECPGFLNNGYMPFQKVVKLIRLLYYNDEISEHIMPNTIPHNRVHEYA